MEGISIGIFSAAGSCCSRERWCIWKVKMLFWSLQLSMDFDISVLRVFLLWLWLGMKNTFMRNMKIPWALRSFQSSILVTRHLLAVLSWSHRPLMAPGGSSDRKILFFLKSAPVVSNLAESWRYHHPVAAQWHMWNRSKGSQLNSQPLSKHVCHSRKIQVDTLEWIKCLHAATQRF